METPNSIGEINLNKRCFKIEKDNAKAMIEGVRIYNRVWYQSIYLGVKEKPFPMLITLNRGKTSYKLSQIGKGLNADDYNILHRYVALLEKEYFVTNEYELWNELCNSEIFDIWEPIAPFSRFETSKTKPSEYRIYLLRIYQIEEKFSREKVVQKSPYIDHLETDNYKVTLKRPIMSDEEFQDYKSRLEHIVNRYTIDSFTEERDYEIPIVNKVNDNLPQCESNGLSILDQIEQDFNTAHSTQKVKSPQIEEQVGNPPKEDNPFEIGESDVLRTIHMQKSQKEGYNRFLEISNKKYVEEEYKYYKSVFNQLRKKNLLMLIKEEGIRFVNEQEIQDYHWEISPEFLRHIYYNNTQDDDNVKIVENLPKIEITDDLIINYLVDIGLSNNLVKVLFFLKDGNSHPTPAIESNTTLRQPEVSIVMKIMNENGWVTETNQQKIGKGRPIKCYSLKLPLSKIIRSIIEMNEKKVEEKITFGRYILAYLQNEDENIQVITEIVTEIKATLCDKCGSELEYYGDNSRCSECDLSYCGECGEYVDDNAILCQSCGEIFDTDEYGSYLFSRSDLYTRPILYENWHEAGHSDTGSLADKNIIFIISDSNEQDAEEGNWWTKDGLYNYQGEYINPLEIRLTGNNEEIKNHIKNGKRIYLFENEIKEFYRYRGEMCCVGHYFKNINENKMAVVFLLAFNKIFKPFSDSFKLRLIQVLTNDFISQKISMKYYTDRINKIINIPEPLDWYYDVLNCVYRVEKDEFTINDLDMYKEYLCSIYKNEKVFESQIEKQFKLLRDRGLIKEIGDGRFKIVDTAENMEI